MMDDVKPQRSYQSSRREQQAQATRAAIIAAARKLFARDGYAATPLRAIASDAGVSEQTIYAVFGSKRALLTTLWETLDADAGVRELRAQLQAAEGQPGRQLDLFVAFDRRLFERSADVMEAARLAGSADPEIGDLLAQGRERGRRGRAAVLRQWREQGVLRPDLSVDEAIDVFVALCSHEVYLFLTAECDWAVERYEEWLRGALRELLLVESAR
jgi:AcrR family transcriptional regulator